MQGMLRFIQAVERGKELHPGPFTIHELYSDLVAEMAELVEAYNQVINSEEPVSRMEDESRDVCVVSYRLAEYLRTIHKKNIMKFDPR